MMPPTLASALALALAGLLCCPGVQAAQGASAPSGPAACAQAAYELGRLYRNAPGAGRDSTQAFGWIHAAAQRGHVEAMFSLSNMLRAGEGVARDEAAARRWLEAAAELDYSEALQQMAQDVEAGALGFERDEARSARLMGDAGHAMKHRQIGSGHGKREAVVLMGFVVDNCRP